MCMCLCVYIVDGGSSNGRLVRNAFAPVSVRGNPLIY